MPQVGLGHAQEDFPNTGGSKHNSASALDDNATSRLHFYLDRPDLSGRRRTVTHVAPEMILGHALRGRLVIEFPTIYALSASPEQLPDTFRFEIDSVQEGGSSDVNYIKREEAAIPASTTQSEVDSGHDLVQNH